MKLIFSLIFILPFTGFAAELDDSVWNGSSSTDAHRTSTFTNDSSLFVGTSTKSQAERRVPASRSAEVKGRQELDDTVWDGASIK